MSEDLIVVERFWVQRNCELLLPILDIYVKDRQQFLQRFCCIYAAKPL